MKVPDFKSLFVSLRARLIARWFHFTAWAKVTFRAGVPLRFWPVVLVIGIVLGIGLKFGAKQVFTLGYNDYLLTPEERLFDINELEQEFYASGKNITPDKPESPYPSCSLYE